MNQSHNQFDEIIKNIEKQDSPYGIVVSVLDNYIISTGLYQVTLGEKVTVNHCYTGIVFDIQEDRVIIFMLNTGAQAHVGDLVHPSGEYFYIEAFENMLGGTFNTLGQAIDEKTYPTEINKKKIHLERPIPSILERKPITQPLETGFLVLDTLIPIGKGQRQLFLGNQNTGKTYTAINIFLANKHNQNMIFIYVAISQQKAKILRVIDYLRKNNVLDKTIIFAADCSDLAINHYLIPFVGCAVAEYFCHDLHKDVVIVYDDLSQQAISYREISLLSRRSPSREAYPGDIFYLHARLLERAGSFLHGSTISAIPIAQLQENDISAYIPTNLISITDGQTIFDTKLFNTNIKPAINTELSVSRVGGAAQFENIRSISKSLRLDLAQFHELELFSQFTSDLDQATIHKLAQGKLLVTLLKQNLSEQYSVFDKYIILYLYKNFKDRLSNLLPHIKDFIIFVTDMIKYNEQSSLYNEIMSGKQLGEESNAKLKEIITELFELYKYTT